MKNRTINKKEEVKKMLASSSLIAQSGYTVEQWHKILEVIPADQLDELYGFLLLETQAK